MNSGTIVYKFKNGLYLNITNRCSCRCRFCMKFKNNWMFSNYNLRLKKEPTVKEIISAIRKYLKDKKITEFVFCGYGEPLIRLKELKEVAAFLKKHHRRVRINTTGQANLYWQRNILPELKGLVDEISVSLNSPTARHYTYWHRPLWKDKTYPGIIDFIRQAKKYIPRVTITAIDMPGIDKNYFRNLAKRLKVKFRLRPYL